MLLCLSTRGLNDIGLNYPCHSVYFDYFLNKFGYSWMLVTLPFVPGNAVALLQKLLWIEATVLPDRGFMDRGNRVAGATGATNTPGF